MRDRKFKATIVTIYDPMPNIGNRLQNYAAQEVLKGLGLQVTSLSFQKPVLSGKKKIKYIAQRLSRYHLPGDTRYWKLLPQRIKAFEAFNKKYIVTQRIRKINQIKQADYYVVGSDQVWNPKWYDDCDMKKEIFLLTFAKEKQKVCFSPSFSVNELPSEWVPWFEKHLSSFPMLAVREEAGGKIISELTGKKAAVTIDPTLMLDRMEWNKIASKPSKIECNKNFILTYFLGGRSEQINKDLEKYASEVSADVYNLLDMEQPDLYKCDPSEFIYLISHAKLIITDSFHACVFSFIYGKPFLLYKRSGSDNMMSRMITFFEKFDLKRKYIDSGLDNELLECDYQNGYSVLMKERKKLIQFLRTSMHIN